MKKIFPYMTEKHVVDDEEVEVLNPKKFFLEQYDTEEKFRTLIERIQSDGSS